MLAILVFSIVLIGLSAVNATDPATTNNTTLNSTNGTALHNTSKVTKQSTSVMKGYWMFSQDVNSAKIGGAAGFVLFRYNFGCSYVPTWT